MTLRRLRHQIAAAALGAALPLASLATVVYYDWGAYSGPTPAREFGGAGFVAFDVAGPDLENFVDAPMVDFEFKFPDSPTSAGALFSFSDMAPATGTATAGAAKVASPVIPGRKDDLVFYYLDPFGTPYTTVYCAQDSTIPPRGRCGLSYYPLATGAAYAGEWRIRPLSSVPLPGALGLTAAGLFIGFLGMRSLRWLLD